MCLWTYLVSWCNPKVPKQTRKGSFSCFLFWMPSELKQGKRSKYFSSRSCWLRVLSFCWIWVIKQTDTASGFSSMLKNTLIFQFWPFLKHVNSCGIGHSCRTITEYQKSILSNNYLWEYWTLNYHSRLLLTPLYPTNKSVSSPDDVRQIWACLGKPNHVQQ